MGEGTSRVVQEIAAARYELDELLAELDRRRHELFDLRAQLRRHALGATLTGLAFVATAAAGVGLGAWRRRRRQRLAARAGRLTEAISRMAEHPERVAAEPTMAGKIIAAAASAAAAALAKKLLERGVERVLAPDREDAEPPGRKQKGFPRAA
jgi:hypothetical protein